MTVVSLIVAMDAAGVIGRDNSLPWHLPEDLKRFKSLTMGKPILMGRRTFESIGKPLPGRKNLVLTRMAGWTQAGVTAVHSLEEALDAAGFAAELVVIGGAEVFALALPFARRIYLTEVHAQIAGDRRFPPFDRSQWRETERSTRAPDERHPYAMTFLTLER